MNREELRKLAEENALVLIPFGGNEQHGPHLPTGTGFMLAEAACDIAAKSWMRWASRGDSSTVTIYPTHCTTEVIRIVPGSQAVYGLSHKHSQRYRIPWIQKYMLCQRTRREWDAYRHGCYGYCHQIRHPYFPGFRIMWDAMGFEAILDTQSNIFHADEVETSYALALDESLVDPVIRKPKVEMYKSERPMDVRAGLFTFLLPFETRTETGILETAMLPPGKGEQLWEAVASHLVQALLDPDLWQ